VNFSVPVDQKADNPARKLGFIATLGMLITVCGVLPEILYSLLHGANLYLLYILTPPALVAVLLSGGLERAYRSRAAWYWTAFFVWMLISLPFSTWRGDSFNDVYNYIRVQMPLLIVVAGLATTWKEIRTMCFVLAFSGFLSLLFSRFFATEDNGRLTLGAVSTTIGNSNDLAQHLAMLLPFILFVVVDRGPNVAIRFITFMPLIIYGVWVILGTASRGGLLALVAMFLYMLFRASNTQRMLAMVLGVVMVVALPAILPDNARVRLMTLVGGAEHEEAKESQESRAYLFRKSIDYTLQHPILGVGPGQFPNYEGRQSIEQGKLGNWHATHCSWTQISSECGIPALLFMILGIGSAIAGVNSVYKQARMQGFKEIETTCFCYMTSMVGLIVALTFLANAYRSYLPIMVGMAIAINRVAKQHMASNPQPVAVPAFAFR